MPDDKQRASQLPGYSNEKMSKNGELGQICCESFAALHPKPPRICQPEQPPRTFRNTPPFLIRLVMRRLSAGQFGLFSSRHWPLSTNR